MEVQIENGQLLTDRFGYWPSFHDAEIVRARFEREGADAPFLEFDIHVFEMTSDLDEKGRYVSRKHTLTTIRCCDIILEEFKGWNHQNVIWELCIVPLANTTGNEKDDGIEVLIRSSYGCECELVCKKVRIIKVDDCSEEGSIRSL